MSDAEFVNSPAKTPRRRPWLALTAVLAFAAVLFGGYMVYINRALGADIRHWTLLPGDQISVVRGSDGVVDKDLTVVDKDGNAVAVKPGTKIPNTKVTADPNAGKALNILLIGSDTRKVGVDRGRSDVMILVHISSDRKRIDLVHFPRDLFVEIPGLGGRAKINAAYAYGGAPLAVKTVESLVQVPVDHVMLFNFESFKAITDAVGGVDVYVAEASPGYPVGQMHMDGEQALAFVRERKALSQGDISRGKRQQAFIRGAAAKVLSAKTFGDPKRTQDFLSLASKYVVVDKDFTASKMRDLGVELGKLNAGDLTFVTAPWTGVADDPTAGSIVLMAADQMEILANHLRADTMATYVDNVSPKKGFGS